MNNLLSHAAAFLAAVALTWGGYLLWRRWKAAQSSAPPETAADLPVEPSDPLSPKPAPPTAARLRAWVAENRGPIAVGLILALLVIYVAALRPGDVVGGSCWPPHLFCRESYYRGRDALADEAYLARGPVERPPFAMVQPVWQKLTERMGTWIQAWPVAGTIAVLLFWFFGWRSGRGRQATMTAGLLGVLVVAVEGQLLLAADRTLLGRLLYVVAAAGFVVWLIERKPEPVSEAPTTQKVSWQEVGLLVLILALTAYARFAYIERIPYGIQGDESSWTSEIVGVMVEGRMVRRASVHVGAPGSYYMQAPFHHLLGPSIRSARIATATYSVLGSLAFYWLVRQLFGRRVALLSTLLLAVSLADVAAGRMALVEGYVKIWVVTGLACLVTGLRTGRLAGFFLSGLAFALGALTYETSLPVIGVALLFAAITWVRRREPLASWMRHLTAFVVPLLAVAPFAVVYVLERKETYYFAGGIEAWGTAPLSTLLSSVLDVVRNFWLQSHSDSFYIPRQGAIVNGLLVPFLFLGLILALARARRARYALPALWFLLVFFVLPVYTRIPAVRIFYPGFPAIYVLVALSMLLIWREVRALVAEALRPALQAAGGLALASVVVLSLFFCFNDLDDPLDRRMRREFADMVAQGVAPERRLYLPFVEGDYVEWEQMLGVLEAQRALPGERVVELIWIGSYDALYQLLAAGDEGATQEVVFLINRANPDHRDAVALLAALERCLDLRLERGGGWFDLYTVDALDEADGACLVDTRP